MSSIYHSGRGAADPRRQPEQSVPDHPGHEPGAEKRGVYHHCGEMPHPVLQAKVLRPANRGRAGVVKTEKEMAALNTSVGTDEGRSLYVTENSITAFPSDCKKNFEGGEGYGGTEAYQHGRSTR